MTIVIVGILLAGSGAAYYASRGNPTGTTTTTQGANGTVLFSLGQTPRMLGPGITMNYTLSVTPSQGTVGTATMSSTSDSGLSVSLNPTQITFAGASVAVDVSIHANGNVTKGDHAVNFVLSFQGGSSNVTYHFQVLQHLILLLGGTTGPGGFSPTTLYAHTGETVTWLSLDAGSDEYGGQRSVQVVGLNATSPTLTLYSTWSYSFAQPGSYRIEDPLNSVLVADGTVVVS